MLFQRALRGDICTKPPTCPAICAHAIVLIDGTDAPAEAAFARCARRAVAVALDAEWRPDELLQPTHRGTRSAAALVQIAFVELKDDDKGECKTDDACDGTVFVVDLLRASAATRRELGELLAPHAADGGGALKIVFGNEDVPRLIAGAALATPAIAPLVDLQPVVAALRGGDRKMPPSLGVAVREHARHLRRGQARAPHGSSRAARRSRRVPRVRLDARPRALPRRRLLA